MYEICKISRSIHRHFFLVALGLMCQYKIMQYKIRNLRPYKGITFSRRKFPSYPLFLPTSSTFFLKQLERLYTVQLFFFYISTVSFQNRQLFPDNFKLQNHNVGLNLLLKSCKDKKLKVNQ